ncbi:MAG: DEAD/DEAH box helicase [Syntrophomonas sp.]
MNRGAHFYHEALCTELINYLKSQYLGKSEVLLDACEPLLRKTGGLFSEPYIESSPAYYTVESGISQSALPDYLVNFFEQMIIAGLGVYRTPFRHQIEALENAWNGNDLFVSTGTGSGKTECFMWPLIAKLTKEAKENPDSWQHFRGIRTIIMYPMNALVSDQISRLRRLLGDPEGNFIHTFRNTSGYIARGPQFGMYTGRTPYAGTRPEAKQDTDLARSLERILARDNEDFYFKQLLSNGKIPAKKDLHAFINNIRKSYHVPNPEDAEMVTRFEMQNTCPDILITNYSMMEYMLLRPRENSIWESTKAWLDKNPDEKLLFIIDEAHMYRGSAGGEVALLLRRLFYKLGISRDRVQFILTTASMPHKTNDDISAVERFAKDITASENNDKFVYLWGYQDNKSGESLTDMPVEVLERVNINNLDKDEYSRLYELNIFRAQVVNDKIKWACLSDAYQWLYDNLMNYMPFNKLFIECRGKAISISNLAKRIFPQTDKNQAISAIDAMLTIAPMAKDASGSVLFPARMHMLFRGFRGVYACSNPDCPNQHYKNGIALGDVQLVDARLTCPDCYSRVYELYNDRRCGALFFHGFVQQSVGRQYLWTSPGAFFESSKMKEIHLYIPMKGETLPPKRKGSKYPFKQCYLDYSSGSITFDDSAANKEGYRPLWYSEYALKGNPDTKTFYTCPKCRQQLANARITSFSTRGNQAFFNVIRAQFLQQPATNFTQENKKRFPNQGRKVLLFSDSRQRAATLTRDMSLASDEMAVRQLFMLALEKVIEIEERIGDELSLNDVYGYFVQAAIEQNVSLFSNESREIFENHKNTLRLGSSGSGRKNGRAFFPHKSMNFNDAPQDMQEHLLRMFCARYNTLPDAGLCYFEPAYEPMFTAIELLKKAQIYVSEDTFIEVFSAILHAFLSDNVALGHQILDDRRRKVRREYEPFGHSDFIKMPNVIASILKIFDNPQKQSAWMDAFKLFCNNGQHDQVRYFLNMEKLHPIYDPKHNWYRCSRCAAVSPFMLNECCPVCGEKAISLIEDFSPEAFWRKNAEYAIKGGAVRVIDTEEHTAQLGHKDQRSEMWAKTEQYEMRFQDMIEEGETPVDILSSTTTMEVGIDIGSLVAVGLRNMPPMRENYQQRAGRAGRRGASMSTIVTFAEGGPHDTYYFNNPELMFQGEPRQPWIDVSNEKLLTRHLNMIALNAFMQKCERSLDEISTIRFFESYIIDLETYLSTFSIDRELLAILLPVEHNELLDTFKQKLLDSLDELSIKVEAHKDAYGEGLEEKRQKSLLDALYEEGIIPTYSFPKDVVSTYIENNRGIIEYQPERGLDVAISEYAPGRTIVVDKKTYQIGGIYMHTASKTTNPFAPAKLYIEDPNYCKELKRCIKCGWFGFTHDMESENCPFCSSEEIADMLPMIRPWGFSPVNGEEIEPAAVDMQYTSSERPLYSSLPNDNMVLIEGCVNMRVARRANQRIIMLNEGSTVGGEHQGFMICSKCGAAAPGNDPSVLRNIRRPGNQVREFCKHKPINVNLGYDFVTDMLVIEITLPKNKIEVETADAILWRTRAATTLAEALRLTASRILDIEFTDIQAGYRIRYASESLFLDIYLYDSLSSGAGYSSRIAEYIVELLQKTENFLSSCDCDRACNNCLKHYRNQYLQANLDRFAALQLLEWGISGKLPMELSMEKKERYFRSINRLLHEEGIYVTYDEKSGTISLSSGVISKECIVYSAMKKVTNEPHKIYITEEAITDAKPFAIDIIKETLR